jgi:hypothetical protein
VDARGNRAYTTVRGWYPRSRRSHGYVKILARILT